MRRLLQSIIYNRKNYDRPQDAWTCGRAAEGCPCVFGPGAKGECRATGQCVPAKKGDRWVCTRLISLGAACSPGPRPDGTCGCPVPPCRPVRNLRGQRGRLVWLAVSAALGVVLLTLWGGGSTAWKNPGPLTSGHATSAQRCTDCHVEPGGLALGAAAVAARQAAHDALCLKCHDLGPQARSPHGQTAAALAALRAAPGAPAPAVPFPLTAARPLVPGHDLACAACHQEHHGRDFALTQLSDQQCQVCHQSQFASFNSGHPEFTDYPSKRRTRLRFDHVAHLQNHFLLRQVAAQAPTSCSSCHEPSGDGRRMLVRGFDQSCAPCHAGQIEGEGRAGAKGLVFLRLPAIDVGALRAAGEATGEWPAFCEGGLTPFMRWMLESDAAARAALTVLGPRDLADLATATPAQKTAAAQLLWSVKSLFADLVTQGQGAMLKRLDRAAPKAMPRTGQLSADGLLAAQQAWLPNLLTEVAAYRRGEKPSPLEAKPAATAPAPDAAAPTTDTAKSAASDDLLTDAPLPAEAKPAATTPTAVTPAMPMADAELRVAEGGWYRRDENYTVYYRPGGHADAFLTAWLDATAGDPAPAGRAIFAQLADPLAPGLCMKCHSVDTVNAATVVNWRAARPEPEHHDFTTFRHSAHFSLMGDQGCKTCHALDPKSDYAAAFGANRDPRIFHSNFAPLSKNTCTTCHQPGAAGESCQQCHRYHTGDLQTLREPESDFKRPPPAGL